MRLLIGKKGELEKFLASVEREFGDYMSLEDLKQIEFLPNGFSDSCFHDCVCPSLISSEMMELEDGTLAVDIWIDCKNPEERELAGGQQFTICLRDNDADLRAEYGSDDWQDILKHAPLALELMHLIHEDAVAHGEVSYSRAFQGHGELAVRHGFRLY